jgi:predicted metal-dependent hydrolase
MDQDGFRRGVEHFNLGEFFDAHEVWEDVWRATDAPHDKLFLQGLIQVAVALHHHSTGNLVGAQSLLQRAIRNLAGYPVDFGGINRAELSESLAGWLRALQEGSTVPPKPRVQFVER